MSASLTIDDQYFLHLPWDHMIVQCLSLLTCEVLHTLRGRTHCSGGIFEEGATDARPGSGLGECTLLGWRRMALMPEHSDKGTLV